MRWISRVAAVAAAALVLACLCRAVVRAGGGIPEGDGKKVEPVRPGPRPKPKVISLTPASRRRAARERAEGGMKITRLKAAQVVPKTAVLYVSVADVSRLVNASKKLALAKILAEEAVDSKLSAVLKRLRTSGGGSQGQGLTGLVQTMMSTGVDIDVLSSAFRKEFALVGLPPVEEGDGGGRFAAVAACTVASREPLAEMMAKIVGELVVRHHGAYEPIPEKHGGAEIRGLRIEGLEISYAFYHNLFMFGTGKDTLAELINTNLDGPASQLAGDASFKAAEENLGRGADVFYRVDLQGMVGVALSGAIYLDGEGIRERVEVRAPAGRSLLPLKLGEPLATPPKSIDSFSVDTVLYAAAALDSAEGVAEIGKHPQVAIAMQQLGQMAQAFGIDTSLDLASVLSAFGGEVAFGVNLPRGCQPEMLLVLEVKEKSVLGRAEEAISKLASGNMKELSYRGVDIHYAEPPANAGDATALQMVLPSVAYARVGRDLFMVASSLRTMEKAIRQRSFRQSSLREKEDFDRGLSGLIPRRTSILYLDSGRCLETLRKGVAVPGGAELATWLEGSAIVSALEKHLFGLGVVVGQSGDSALLIESSGPVGPVTGVGLVSVALLLNSFGEGAADAPDWDAENLARIGVALHLYATDFDRFPSQLSELYDEYMGDLKYFMAPGEERDVKSMDDIDERCDYVYVRGLSPTNLSDAIIAYSRKPLQGPMGKGRNVLYVGGGVEFLLEGRLEEKLGSTPGK